MTIPLYRVALVVVCVGALSGCVLPPFDDDGLRCPCVSGWSCVDGICVEGTFDGGSLDSASLDGSSDTGDASDPVDAGAGPICEPTTEPYCLDDGDVCAGGTIASTVCVAGELHFCTGDVARAVTCPGACDADGAHCLWAPRYLTTDESERASTTVATFDAGSEPFWLLDAGNGTIRRFATRAELEAGGDAPTVTVPGLAFNFIDHAYYADVVRIEEGVTLIGDRDGTALTIIGSREIFVDEGATISVSAHGADGGPGGQSGPPSSSGDGMAGTGGGGQSCTSTIAFPANTHHEGGGGGSYGTSGGAAGDGGDGDSAADSRSSARPGALRASVPEELTGGFSGGAGCLSSAGGGGGGALYLVSRAVIRIDGTLLSGGGGGEGGGGVLGLAEGGGGGGSGGTIVVEAPVVELRGGLYVHGGSGGEGAGAIVSGGDPEDGADGTDGDARGSASTVGVTNGGEGGLGSNEDGVATRGGDVVTHPNRSGGGGGGAGVVVIIRAPTGAALRSRVHPGVDGSTFFDVAPMLP